MVMYKKAVTSLMLVNLLFLCVCVCVKELKVNRVAAALKVTAQELKLDEMLLADKDYSTLGIAAVAASGQRVVDYQVLNQELNQESEKLYELEEADWEALCRIVEAEAGNEDADGKLLVANVVLNRMEDEHFPDTVTEVVFQQEKGVYQFSPIANGSYYRVSVSEDTYAAVERALEGEDISEGALFFAARQYASDSRMAWFDNHLSYLFQHGGHEFYTFLR
ncbi:MAG: cell wall hydrolase [Candidatus Gastranaerophilales bacterium]|nr:cell wall hydrolase [Candidatus Gastranaerophilales bacterium]